MNGSRFTEIQISNALKSAERMSSKKGVCREYGISQATYDKWKARYGGKSINEIKKTRKFEQKLDAIFKFLKANRRSNLKVQENFYKSIIASQYAIEDKVTSLLYRIASTQAQPKIDSLAESFRTKFQDPQSLRSFNSFVKKINGKEGALYNDLYKGMESCEGWGPKTSALFTKAIYQIHSGKFYDELRFWDDAPSKIAKEDKLFLPVDAVIIAIFNKLGFESCNFLSINNEVGQLYSGPQMEVWDDLWFWGFISQHGSGNDREHKWNSSKYWVLEYSNKDPSEMSRIESKAGEFTRLLN